ncbi:F1 capsule-anchoring protein [Pandoraea iniqua]|uniref:F1 capsule-anchoring protein n=1 Tax=Pandoraea iniqua TaxID=2508288 RepID=A0A5E4WWY9_9BURK|nr:fimbria/pilus outer membrane usher protein [Pandoraea iniqua]VVE28114.1 F1 capsule-anchoring protein [Pandoraea iniqua]
MASGNRGCAALAPLTPHYRALGRPERRGVVRVASGAVARVMVSTMALSGPASSAGALATAAAAEPSVAEARTDVPAATVMAPPTPTPTSPARPDGRYVLDVLINGQPTGLLAPFTRRNGHWFVNAGDLRRLGLSASALPRDDAREVALDTLDGVQVAYDATHQRLDLRLGDAWLTPYRVGGMLAEAVNATADPGLIVNYDGYVQRDRHTQTSVWSEVRGFWSGASVSQTGLIEHSPWRRGYLRYDTAWQRNDPSTLTSWTAGDLITGSLSWTRSVRIAGLQWRRNFSLRPDLVTFPVPALRGSAVVPSSVDLYLDGVRRFGSRVPPGPFVIQEAPGLTGDLQASVVTRDALGREQITTVPLYIDPRLLAKGLSSFSLEAGLPRDDYGVRSFSYRHHPVASVAARYGVTDTLTLEAQAQAGRRLAMGGVGALIALRRAGVISAAMAASGGRRTGAQWSAGYQYISRRVSVDAQIIRTAGRYRDLASLDGSPAAHASERVSVSVPWGRGGTASLAYFGQRAPRQPATRVLSASLNVPASSRGMLSIGGFRDLARRRSHGVFAMLSLLLGNGVLGSASVTQQDGQTQAWASAGRTPDYGGGWGWQVLGGRAFSQRTAQGELRYLGRHGEVSALAQQVGRQRGAALGMTGALVVMDRSLHATRRTYDAFALVSTDGRADVPVLRESVPIGHTDARGYFLVPDLNGFEQARIGIDPMHLPADLEVVTTERRIAPQTGAGVLVRFPVRRYQAALITLVSAAGVPLKPGVSVRHVQSGFITVVGYDGEAFIDTLAPRNTLESHDGVQRCRATFDWRAPPDGEIARVGPLVCIPFGALAHDAKSHRPGARASTSREDGS